MTQKHDLLLVNDFHPETVAELDSRYHTHKLWELPVAQRPELIRQLNGKCRAAATASWRCDPLVYELASLEIISAFGVGVDGIDFDRTKTQGIRVSNTPDVLNDAVADLAVALILGSTRNLINADRFVRDQKWLKGPFPFGRGIAGKTLGIIGLGRIGEAIVQRVLPFKMNIAYHNRNPKNVPYNYYPTIAELAAQSDILLCLLPGGADTNNLINGEIFEQLGPDGVFINVGRGSTVDEDSLIDALQAGKIAAAGLDVYAEEPKVPAALRALDNVVLMPHIGSATVETRRAMGRLVMDNLQAYLSNQGLFSEVV